MFPLAAIQTCFQSNFKYFFPHPASVRYIVSRSITLTSVQPTNSPTARYSSDIHGIFMGCSPLSVEAACPHISTVDPLIISFRLEKSWILAAGHTDVAPTTRYVFVFMRLWSVKPLPSSHRFLRQVKKTQQNAETSCWSPSHPFPPHNQSILMFQAVSPPT